MIIGGWSRSEPRVVGDFGSDDLIGSAASLAVVVASLVNEAKQIVLVVLFLLTHPEVGALLAYVALPKVIPLGLAPAKLLTDRGNCASSSDFCYLWFFYELFLRGKTSELIVGLHSRSGKSW